MKKFVELMVYENTELLQIVKKLLEILNSSSILYLQGGYLRDIISYKVHKVPLPEKFSDYDFAIAGDVWKIEDILSSYGKVQKNFFGGIKWSPYFSPRVKIDLWFINEFWHLKDKNGGFNIFDFFDGVDFTFNQIAFDLHSNSLIYTKEGYDNIHSKTMKLVSGKYWASKEAIFVRLFLFLKKLNFNMHNNIMDFFVEHSDNFNWDIISKYASTKQVSVYEIKKFHDRLEQLNLKL